MNNKIEKSFLKDGELEKINRYTAKELGADEVFVFTATLCDNDIDRDFEKFSTAALYELAPLFIGKTVIADHSMKSGDQMARIFDAYVEKQEGKTTADGEALYALKGRAYMPLSEDNQTLIREIETGIKKEGSVSCSMRRRTCSVCGCNRAEGRCEHIPSRVYNGKRCYTVLEEAQDAYEFSFVAVPAQKNAGITKAFSKTEEIKMEDIITTIKSCSEEGITLSRKQATALNDYLEHLEDEAKLGETYKKELSASVTSLLRQKLPALDAGLIQSVVSVMTAEELMGFKKGLQEHKAPQPQLMTKKEAGSGQDYSQFKI